ncbi:DUF4439 domain-containing protein, partial [Streptomyces hirsutus]|uniref:DUF4439 domain-containing protein n=1 Tax=Streptomyces hirsutus TaxID=35620 RepID=UPI003654B354
MSEAKDRELRALQAALAAEHAAVYGYGVVGGRIADQRRGGARHGPNAPPPRRGRGGGRGVGTGRAPLGGGRG